MKDLLLNKCLNSDRIEKIKQEYSAFKPIIRGGKICITEALKHYYYYNAVNGRLYYKNSGLGITKGSEVGYIDKQKHTHKMHIKDYNMLTASVVWYIEKGKIQEYCIGYRDGDKANTNIDNLFEINRRIRKNTFELLSRLV